MARKKTTVRKKTSSRDEMRPEYHFDYAKAKPNRFAHGKPNRAVNHSQAYRDRAGQEDH